MKQRAKRILGFGAAALILTAYPAFVLLYTWSHVARIDLPGGRHGPLDAYRHALASAVVAYTLGPRAVEWSTSVLEDSANPAHQMDRHNNRIGATIGSRARSFGEIEPLVRAEVLRGAEQAIEPAQITWLPPARWRAGMFW